MCIAILVVLTTAGRVNICTHLPIHTARRVVIGTDVPVHMADAGHSLIHLITQHIHRGKSSESVQLAMLKACDACADMGQ